MAVDTYDAQVTPHIQSWYSRKKFLPIRGVGLLGSEYNTKPITNYYNTITKEDLLLTND